MVSSVILQHATTNCVTQPHAGCIKTYTDTCGYGGLRRLVTLLKGMFGPSGCAMVRVLVRDLGLGKRENPGSPGMIRTNE